MSTPTTLTVSVSDPQSRPLAAAQVTHVDSDGSTLHSTTDQRGMARFDVDPSAPATVSVSADGFAPDSRLIGGGYPTRPDGVEQFLLGPEARTRARLTRTGRRHGRSPRGIVDATTLGDRG